MFARAVDLPHTHYKINWRTVSMLFVYSGDNTAAQPVSVCVTAEVHKTCMHTCQNVVCSTCMRQMVWAFGDGLLRWNCLSERLYSCLLFIYFPSIYLPASSSLALHLFGCLPLICFSLPTKPHRSQNQSRSLCWMWRSVRSDSNS